MFMKNVMASSNLPFSNFEYCYTNRYKATPKNQVISANKTVVERFSKFGNFVNLP